MILVVFLSSNIVLSFAILVSTLIVLPSLMAQQKILLPLIGYSPDVSISIAINLGILSTFRFRLTVNII